MFSRLNRQRLEPGSGAATLRRMLIAVAVCSTIGSSMAGVTHAQTCQKASPMQPELIVNSAGNFVPNAKNRFLSFSAGDVGRQQAIRIVFVDLPAPYDIWNGGAMWVGQPTPISEGGSCIEPVGGCATFPTFMAAGLACDVPFFADWSTIGTIHVHHEGIIPGATYVVQVLDSTCDQVIEADYSAAQTMTTSIWGDVAGSFNSAAGAWSASDGTVDIGTDTIATLQAFASIESSVSKTRANLGPRNISLAMQISDVISTLNAFNGFDYPYGPDGPFPCQTIIGGQTVCGNGLVEAGEQCDDGNTATGDGCGETCLFEAVCGNGTLEAGEQCDDGNTSPGDGCDTVCRVETVCGDGLLETGEECDDGNTTPGDGCNELCRIEASATLALVPRSADGTHTVSGNEITLTSAGQRVTLDLMLSGWDPDQDGTPAIGTWQVALDSAGFASGMLGQLTLAAQACTGVPGECEAAFGGACSASGALCSVTADCPSPTFEVCAGVGCTTVLGEPNMCSPAFFLLARPDFIFQSAPLNALDLSQPSVRWGSIAGNGNAATDTGVPVYLGTLVLDVPLDAAGTFTVGVKTAISQTNLADAVGGPVPIATYEPAIINVVAPVGCCDPVGGCLTAASASECASTGGTVVPACGMDDNGNSINDACEVAACCTGGTCDVIPALDCLPQGGEFVCGCVTSACDTCDVSVVNAPLAEDGMLGTCTIDADCAGATTCIGGVCYIPKNRYVSFRPTNPDACIAYRIDLTSSATFPGCTFATKWVGDPDPATGIARVVDAPVYRNWTEAVVHVGDSEIVPESTYELRAIQEACDASIDTEFSAPLALPTAVWGDIVGQCSVDGFCTPPDGIVLDSDFDILAVEQAWSGESTLPLTRVDLMPEVPDRDVLARDILASLRATNGKSYSDEGVSPCAVSFESFIGDEATANGAIAVTGVCPPDPPPPSPTKMRCELSATTVLPNGIAEVNLSLENMSDLVLFETTIGICGVDDIADQSELVHLDCSFPFVNGGKVPVSSPDFVFAEWVDFGLVRAKPRCNRIAQAYGILDVIPGVEVQPSGSLSLQRLKVEPSASGQTFEVFISLKDTVSGQTTEVSTLSQSVQPLGGSTFAFEPIPITCGTITVPFDCDGNLVADDCDIDCNSTGLGAPCDLNTCGTRSDCNNNSIPDLCEIPIDPSRPGEFSCAVDCVGCPTTCVCSISGAPCDAGTCPTGDGNPLDVVSCDPDCNGNGTIDVCEITMFDGGFCGTNPCLSDCQLDGIPDECNIAETDGGFCVGAACSADCTPVGDTANGIPDECEADCDSDGLPDICESVVAEQDCDNDGTCNAVQIADCDGSPACGDCNASGAGNGIPDKCDIAVADGGLCEGPNCLSDCQENGEPGKGVPDVCDVDPTDPDGDGFVSGDCAWDGIAPNGIPDTCEFLGCDQEGLLACSDCNGNMIPDACDLADGTSCDANGTSKPDTCEPAACALDRELAGEDCNDFRFPEAGVDTTALGAALRIVWLDGSVTDIENLSGTVAIAHETPHLHGDASDTIANGEPGVTPPGFPVDSLLGHEVHLSMVGLSLTNGADSLTLGTSDTLGEAQATCVDFPADAFFNLFVTLTVGAPPAPLAAGVALSNHTPIVMRDTVDRDIVNIPNFDWSLLTVGSSFLSNHTAPAIPLVDAAGVHRAYLVRAQFGDGLLSSGGLQSGNCDLSHVSTGAFATGVNGPVSFAVAGATDGVEIDPPSSNSVNDDKGFTQQQVRIYVSSGASAGAAPDTTNLTDALISGDAPGGFSSTDAIESLSFGRDGTRFSALPDHSRLLYFSVSRTSSGRGSSVGINATDVSLEALQGEVGADIFVSDLRDEFGSYEANPEANPEGWPCHSTRGNCLALEQTSLGLGPLSSGLEGALDDLTALERGRFGAGDRAYLSFTGPSFEGSGAMPPENVPTTIFMYDGSTGFTVSTLTPYVQLGTEAGGLGILQPGDIIDALAVSDVDAAGAPTPDGIWSSGDQLLLSLAPTSPSVKSSTLSAADIFLVRFDSTAPLSSAIPFRTSAQLGLLVSDDVDAIDVGAGQITIETASGSAEEVEPDCNKNAIVDQCDIDRNFSVDVDPMDGIPDECFPPCPEKASRPVAEDGRACSSNADCGETADCRDTNGDGSPDTCYLSKMRFLSFSAGDAGRMQAIRITFKQLPPQFAYAEGRSVWVGAVSEASEVAGKSIDKKCATGETCFNVARIRCSPLYRDWSSVGVMHVFGTELVSSSPRPGVDEAAFEAIYEIEVIDELPCDPNRPGDFSPSLFLGMSRWGDVTRGAVDGVWGPPSGMNEQADLTDVVALLHKFQGHPFPLRKVRAEISSNALDMNVDIFDLVAALLAFSDPAYPFSGPPLVEEVCTD